MFLGLVASIAIPLVGVAVYGIWNVVQEERGHAGEALQLQAQTFAALLDHHVGDTQALLGSVIASANLLDGDLDRIGDALRAVDLPDGDLLAIASTDGAVLLNTLVPERPGQASTVIPPGYLLDLLRSHVSGVTNLYRGPRTGIPRIAIVRPMTLPFTPAASTYGIIYSMQASRVVEELFTGVFPVGLAIEVSDRNGTVVAGSQRLVNRVGQPVAAFVVEETSKAESGLFRLPEGAAVPGSIAFAHSRVTGFTVMVNASDSSISPSVRAHVARMLLATALLCLPGIVLIVATTRRLAAGLGLLAEIGGGKVFGLRLSAVREIDAAATTLIAAKSAEAAAHERLRLLNVSLESRVEQAVAELELARERTMHARRLETLGSLASGVAHDFGNVLQVVDGCGSLILENLDDGRAVERWAVMLEAEVKRGMAVVQRLMSYSRKEALQAAEANVALLLDGVADILRHTLPKRIRIVVDVPPDLPGIWTDKAQLETVLMNLGTNARDAMSEGGTFTLSAELIAAVDRGSGAEYIRIDATDTGTGMPAEILARATEPFFTTKEVGKGTGLGLAMARDFAEKSGGQMTIASKPAQGTTVSLFIPVAQEVAPPVERVATPPMERVATLPMERVATLPVERVATLPVELVATLPLERVATRPLVQAAAHGSAAASTRIAAPASRTSLQVLLIEDSGDVREVIARSLRKLGFSVAVEAEGQPAVARIAAGEKLDVVITDYWLAGLPVDDIISRLHCLTPGLPIVLLTGDTTDAEAFLRNYAFRQYVRLMSKPVSGLDLAESIEALLQDRHGVDALSLVNASSQPR